jgi:hypothetical protein
MKRYLVDSSGVIKFISDTQPCPICGVELSINALHSHIANSHRLKSNHKHIRSKVSPKKSSKLVLPQKGALIERDSPKSMSQSINLAPKTICPVCKVEVRIDRLKKHITKTHQNTRVGMQKTNNIDSKSLSNPSPNSQNFRNPPKKQSMRCPICQIKFHPDLLKNHLARNHKILSKSTVNDRCYSAI